MGWGFISCPAFLFPFSFRQTNDRALEHMVSTSTGSQRPCVGSLATLVSDRLEKAAALTAPPGLPALIIQFSCPKQTKLKTPNTKRKSLQTVKCGVNFNNHYGYMGAEPQARKAPPFPWRSASPAVGAAPDTDSPSGHPPPLQLGPLLPFWKKGPHVYYSLFIKLIPSDSGIGNHEKNYHKHQDQLADKCFLGNRGVWSWSHRGSLWTASCLLWQSHPHSVKQDEGRTLCSQQSKAVPANHPFCGDKKSFSLPPGSQASRSTHSITWANSGDMPRQARRAADRERLHFLGRKAEEGPEPPA